MVTVISFALLTYLLKKSKPSFSGICSPTDKPPESSPAKMQSFFLIASESHLNPTGVVIVLMPNFLATTSTIFETPTVFIIHPDLPDEKRYFNNIAMMILGLI